MQEAQNTRVVQDAFDAFGRADMPRLMATFDDSIVWKPVTGAAPSVPFGGERRGKAAVGEFFRIVAETETFEQFEPREFVAQGDMVVALGHYKARTKSTGKTFESDFVMVFTLRNGRIVRFQEFLDSGMLNAAFEPVAV